MLLFIVVYNLPSSKRMFADSSAERACETYWNCQEEPDVCPWCYMTTTIILTPPERTAVFLGTLPKGPSTQMVLLEAEYVRMNSFGSKIHLVYVLGPLIGLGCEILN